MSISTAIPPLINALGKPELVARHTMMCVVAFPVAFLAGAKLAGVPGICIAWLIMLPLSTAVLLSWTRQLTGIGIGDVLRALMLVIAGVAVMVATVIAVRHAMAGVDSAHLRLVVEAGVGAITYAAFILLAARHSLVKDVLILLQEIRGKGSASA